MPNLLDMKASPDIAPAVSPPTLAAVAAVAAWSPSPWRASAWHHQESVRAEHHDRLLAAFALSAVAAEFPDCGRQVSAALDDLSESGARTVLELLPHGGASWAEIYRSVVPDVDWTSSTEVGFPHYSRYVQQGGSRNLDALVLHGRFDNGSVSDAARQYRHLLRPGGLIVYQFGRNEFDSQPPPAEWASFIERYSRAIFGWRSGQLHVGWVKPMPMPRSTDADLR
jgi:hypothetical protein